MIEHYLYEVLRGLAVPVLLSHQQQVPIQWQEEGADGELIDGGRTGLAVYLRQQAPDGYFQIEEPIPLSSDGLTGNIWVTVTALAADPHQAQLLALRARALLVGTPYEPSQVKEVVPGIPKLLDPEVWISRTTYALRTFDGVAVT